MRESVRVCVCVCVYEFICECVSVCARASVCVSVFVFVREGGDESILPLKRTLSIRHPVNTLIRNTRFLNTFSQEQLRDGDNNEDEETLIPRFITPSYFPALNFIIV